MSNKIETRAFRVTELRIANDDGKRTLSGYAAVFDSPSENFGGWTERIDPGAFDHTLSTNPDVRCLVEHDPARIVGRTKSGTLRLTKDNVGLRFDCDLPDTSVARDLITSIERRDLDACSFGFITNKESWEDNKTTGEAIRTLLDVDLIDTSVVCFPAYPATSVNVRSLPDSMPVEMRSRFEKRASEKTKRVDGEDLPADAFLIVGDPDKTDTWHLPWKFSTDEKTKSHLRDALSRFEQVEGVDKETLAKAKDKLLKLCKQYGIDVSEEKSLRALTDQCTCTCPQCLAESCGICSADTQCEGAERSSQRSSPAWHDDAMLRLRLAEAL